MKQIMLIAAAGLIALTGGCRSNEPVSAFANPVDACAAIADDEDRERCIKDVVADVANAARREQERRGGPR